MAVYTRLSAEELTQFLKRFEVGDLLSFKGIAEGVENSNFLVETEQDGRSRRFILTLYEKRVSAADLPYFMAMLDHLAARGQPVPPAIADREGREIHELAGRPACLIRFLPGVSVSHPTPAQAFSAGSAMGAMHGALADFAPLRENSMGHETWWPLFERCGTELNRIDPMLHDGLGRALEQVLEEWPTNLPTGPIHADLFPDNVLMLGDRVTGLIDFYFACTDITAYDLAVMHSAWAFSDDGRTFHKPVGDALIRGYGGHRSLTADERVHFGVLAKGACMRFCLSRAWDWLNTPADALVTRKDPMAYMNRYTAYAGLGGALLP